MTRVRYTNGGYTQDDGPTVGYTNGSFDPSDDDHVIPGNAAVTGTLDVTGTLTALGYFGAGGNFGIGSGASQGAFFGATAVSKPTVTGVRDEPESALASLLTALASLGLIVDDTDAT